MSLVLYVPDPTAMNFRHNNALKTTTSLVLVSS